MKKQHSPILRSKIKEEEVPISPIDNLEIMQIPELNANYWSEQNGLIILAAKQLKK